MNIEDRIGLQPLVSLSGFAERYGEGVGEEREAERERIIFRHSAKRYRVLFKRLGKGQ